MQGLRQLFISTALAAALPMTVFAEDVWLQIEARPTEAEAQARAADYARQFPNVAGFRLPSGWYGIVLGPVPAEEAQSKLQSLKATGEIPADSFVARTPSFGQPFWPSPDAPAALAPDMGTDAATVTQPADQVAAPEPVAPDDGETLADARADEAALTAEERSAVQSALTFAGHYDGDPDGRFGRGTRGAIAAWQTDQGATPTGVLTRSQRLALVAAWTAEETALGLAPVTEAEAGLSLKLPLGLVAFDRYDPPFVRYAPVKDSGVTVLLVSAPGGREALSTLSDRLIATGIMPTGIDLTPSRSGLSSKGADGSRAAVVEVRLTRGGMKGFVLAGPAASAARLSRTADLMKAGLTVDDDTVLDETMGTPSTISAADLVAGLTPGQPSHAQSGVYVSAEGLVLTTAPGLADCPRPAIDRLHPAKVIWTDSASGLALLQPEKPLAPRAVASLAATLPAPGDGVAVGGYPYGERLTAPVTAFGRFAEATGLDGQAGEARLRLVTRPGDAGSAVLDGSGALIGVLLPQAEGSPTLPDDVALMRSRDALERALATGSHTLGQSPAAPSLAPEDLAARARALAALVTCEN